PLIFSFLFKYRYPIVVCVMTVVGFNVTKEEREELIAIAREIYLTKFPHPQIQGEYITFSQTTIRVYNI
ncbi:MAG: hypothetical protein WA667_16310, partial [Candidatus Nitrosopolaris sp.]